MLLFKKIDAYAQVLLIVAGVIFCIAVHGDDESVLSYYIVGGWQVLSALIHLLGFTSKPALKGRKWYLFTLLFLLITVILLIATSSLNIAFGALMIFISPLLAVWYCVTCFREIKLWEQYESPVTT